MRLTLVGASASWPVLNYTLWDTQSRRLMLSPGTLMSRGQFTSASTTSQLADCWMVPGEHAQSSMSQVPLRLQSCCITCSVGSRRGRSVHGVKNGVKKGCSPSSYTPLAATRASLDSSSLFGTRSSKRLVASFNCERGQWSLGISPIQPPSPRFLAFRRVISRAAILEFPVGFPAEVWARTGSNQRISDLDIPVQ